MKVKGVLSLLLAAAMTVSMAIPAFAATDVSNAEMSAEEYFATEYRFELIPRTPQEPDAYIFRYSQELINMGISGYDGGYLYKTSFEHLYDPAYTKLIYPEKVTAFSRVRENIYACVENEIFSIDYAGNNRKTILTVDGFVTHMSANDVLIYYVINDVLYRYFIPTQQLDMIGSVPGIPYMTLYSNQQVYWSKPNPEWSEEAEALLADDDLGNDIPSVLGYIIKADTKGKTAGSIKFDMTPAEEEGFIMSLLSYSRQSPRSSSTSHSYSSINGKTVPLTEVSQWKLFYY